MKMTDREKKRLARFRELESDGLRDDAIFQVETMLRAQEIVKAEYGLPGPNAPLFTGLITRSPSYADRRPAPMGAALAGEALHG